jgi:dTDP-glucose 4,6-dehydratase
MVDDAFSLNDAPVLVTGGAGFIGSHLVDALLRHPEARVTVLDKLTYAGSKANLAQHEGDHRLRFVHGDVADPSVVDPLVRHAARVIHAAAETHVDRSIGGPAEFVMTNVVGTQVVLDACRSHERPLLLVSTDEVYGQNDPDGMFDEDSPLRPRSPYAASKAAAELLARSYGATYGLPVWIVRGTNAFGPRQNPEKAIPVFTTAALEGRALPVYAEGKQSREWLYVTDWAAACITALHHGEPGDVFNIGNGFELPNVELARTICRLVGADESLVTFVEDRPGHDFRYGMTSERLHELGWRPEVPFDEGLLQTVEWYRANPDWVRAMRAGAGA